MTRCGYTPETHRREAPSVNFGTHPHKAAATAAAIDVLSAIIISRLSLIPEKRR
jgi:hypothetical protein